MFGAGVMAALKTAVAEVVLPVLVVVLTNGIGCPLMKEVPVMVDVVAVRYVDNEIWETPLNARVTVVVLDVRNAVSWPSRRCEVVWKTVTDVDVKIVKPMKPVV